MMYLFCVRRHTKHESRNDDLQQFVLAKTQSCFTAIDSHGQTWEETRFEKTDQKTDDDQVFVIFCPGSTNRECAP